MRKHPSIYDSKKGIREMAKMRRETTFTKADLEANQRAYSLNFIKLMETVGKPGQAQYIEIERKLNYRNCMILRELGLLFSEFK